MTVKDIRKYIFSGTKVRLIYQHETIFSGRANELEFCEYKDALIKEDGITLGIQEVPDLIIIISELEPRSKFPVEFDSYIICDDGNPNKRPIKIPIHITVLYDYKNYYTKEIWYSIRVETKCEVNGNPITSYQFVSEYALRKYFERKAGTE